MTDKKLCRMCHRPVEMTTPPDNYTCSILCQKLRLGQITKDDWKRQGGQGELPVYDGCGGYDNGCQWAGVWGAWGILPPGHARIKHGKGIHLVHDGLPFPSYLSGEWVVVAGDWVQFNAV